jgi:hypothetical protein
MEIGLIAIFAIRLLVPLLMLRWPLFGAIASLVVDAADTNIVKLFGVEIPNYAATDKLLDTYYLTIQVVLSLKWANKLARNTSIFLYIWRLIGVVSFELNPALRFMLFLAPNIFEHFFIYHNVMMRLGKETTKKMWLNSYKRAALVVFLLWLTKIPQELVLHVWQVKSPVEEFLAWLQSIKGK